jgi:hypothetical protein
MSSTGRSFRLLSDDSMSSGSPGGQSIEESRKERVTSRTWGRLRLRHDRHDLQRKEHAVKYVALVYTNPGAFEAMPQAERDAFMREADAYLKEYTESGELLAGGIALADASTSKTVRGRNGLPAVTDGPFAEAKEQLAGFYVLDTETLERATEIVAHDPAARVWAVEVRPVMDEAGAEM